MTTSPSCRDASWYHGPCADLYDPTNKQVQSSCGGNPPPAAYGFTLAVTGQYTIRVHDSGYVNTGTFGLMLDCWNPVVVASQLTLGLASNGTTAHGETIDDWTFAGTVGEDVTVQVQSSYYNGPCFILVAPGGVQSPQICGGNPPQARKEYILAATGTYLVIVNSSGYGAASGTYSFARPNALASCTAQSSGPPQSQTITFGALSTQALGTTPIALTATASSGLAVTLTSNSPLVCTVSGLTVTLVGTGTCSLTANQTGNSTYAAATPVTQTFMVTGSMTPVITSISLVSAQQIQTITITGSGFGAKAAYTGDSAYIKTVWTQPSSGPLAISTRASKMMRLLLLWIRGQIRVLSWEAFRALGAAQTLTAEFGR